MQSFTSAASPSLSVEAMCQLLSAHQASTPVPASPPNALSSSFHSRLSLASAFSDSGLLGSGGLSADTSSLSNSSSAATVNALNSQLSRANQRIQELEYALNQKVRECSQLDLCRQRVQELETLYSLASKELQDKQAQSEIIRKQQIQIIVLEEQLKMAHAGSGKLGSSVPDLRSSTEQLQLQAALLMAGSLTGNGGSQVAADGGNGSSGMLQGSLSLANQRPSHGGTDFTRDQEVFPVNSRNTTHHNNSILSASLADAWSLAHAPSAPQPVMGSSADAWQQMAAAAGAAGAAAGAAAAAAAAASATSQAPTAFGALASSSWDHNSLLQMTRAQSMVDALPSHGADNDIFNGLDMQPKPRGAHGHHHLAQVHHLAGLLPPDFERALDSYALDSYHSSNNSSGMAGELRHPSMGHLAGTGSNSMGGGRPSSHHLRQSGSIKQHQGSLSASIMRANSLPHPDLSKGLTDQERSINSSLRPPRKWTDTWGPEGDGDDSCDAAADTEDQDQDGGCISQTSPGHDDKGEDPGAPQELDAAAQNARLRSKQDAQPNTCVYVGFLGWWVTEKDLQDYFSPYGQLASVRLLISKKSRRSREQAFVEYSTVDQAQRAITWLDSIDYPALVKQLGCGGLVVRFADRKKPLADM